METQITSHLLAALNLPPLRDVAPYPDSDRPLPLEPSASQEAYPARRPLPPPQHNGQQPQGDESHQKGGAADENPASVSTAYPPIITPPQAVDPPIPQPTTTLQPQQVPPETPENTSNRRPQAKNKSSNRRARRKWTEQETNDLIMGCHEHGVGNWKKVLDDPRFNFNGRSSVDLKDRFRTCFPKEYRKDAMGSEDMSEVDAQPEPEPAALSPNPLAATPSRDRGPKRRVTKTELHHAEVLEKLGIEGHFPKVQRRERREFTMEEDKRLLQGFTIYGASWSRIQNDPALHLNHRRSTDLRDRFRNAFPDRYESAGFKARPRHPRPRLSRTPDAEGSSKADDDDADDEAEQLPQLDPAMEETAKADSTAFIVQSLLNEHLAANWVGPETEATAPLDQAPAPGSLALDPALNAGFEGSSLEQLTNDLLAATHDKDAQRDGELVRWEDMAAHPIFEVETSFTMPARTGNGEVSKPAVTLNANTSPKLTAASSPRKRPSEPLGTSGGSEEKRQRVAVQTA